MKLSEIFNASQLDLNDPDPEKRRRARQARLVTAPFTTLFGFAVMALGWLGIARRTPEDFLLYGGFIAAGFGAVCVLVAVISLFVEGLPSLRSATLLVVLVPVGLAFLGASYYAIGAGVVETYRWLSKPSDPSTVPMIKAVAGGLITAVGGGLLFFFRLRLRSLYGATEALVGVVVACQRVVDDAASTMDTSIAVLTAGIYLVVRGLDNVHTGLYDDKKADPLARKWHMRFVEMWNEVPDGPPLTGPTAMGEAQREA